MAQRVEVVLEDDLDGGKADETILFSLDGTNYEIDLSAKNAAKLRDALAVYVGHGRKVTRSRGRNQQRTPRRQGPSPADVREWARGNGYEVSDRGRVPEEIRQAYDAAH